MFVQNTKLRRLTLGLQLFAGVGLLTASYFTTDSGWTNELKAAMHTEAVKIHKSEHKTTSFLGC